jgi:hypothetical protein
MKKISVVINKNWETEPVLDALTNSEIRPPKLPFPVTLNSPRDKDNKMNIPRATFKFRKRNPDKTLENTLEIKIWCIQDLMYLGVAPDPVTQSSSSSEEKYYVLPPELSGDSADLVIAVGTAGYPSSDSFNGSVVIGSNFFIHNGDPGNPKSNLKHDKIGKLLPSNINEKLFEAFSKDFKNAVELKFLAMPRNPAVKAECIASKDFTALSSVNVTDYTKYKKVDPEAVQHYKQVEPTLPLSSIETTHGVIKLSTDKPIIFLSAIADRLGFFDEEVTPTQNYAAAFNAGIVLGQLFISLNDLALGGFDFNYQ